jgi:hypothetical protein
MQVSLCTLAYFAFMLHILQRLLFVVGLAGLEHACGGVVKAFILTAMQLKECRWR